MINIPASFNLLLGRQWIHGLDGVASSLYQKIRFITNENKIIKLCEDSWIRATEASSSASILEGLLPKHGVTNTQFFEFMNMIDDDLPIEYSLLCFDQYVNHMVAGIMKKMRYFPGMGLGRKLQGIVEPVKIDTQRNSFGLVYKPTELELRESEKRNREERRPYKKTPKNDPGTFLHKFCNKTDS